MNPTHRINGAMVAALLGRTVPVDQAPDAWPVDPPEATGEVCALAGEILATVRSGFAVVHIDSGGRDDHELCTVAWNLCTAMCRPMPQYRTGELIYPVEVTESTPGVSHYSGSNRSGGHHTDGTLLPQPPDLAALLGLEAAETGGETIMMDGAALCAQLEAADPAHLRAFGRPHHFDVQGQIEGLTTKRQPLVRGSGEDFELRYLRRYIEQGYAAAGEPLPDDLRVAMDLFDRLSSEEANQAPVLLARGVLLLWNNRRMLHGRRPFAEGGSRRRLRRVYGRYDGGRPAVARARSASA